MGASDCSVPGEVAPETQVSRTSRDIRKRRNWHEEHAAGRTAGERTADRVAATVGSWPFIVIQSVLLVGWIAWNTVGVERFDKPPYILLNLLLSFQAAYTGPVVMMSQNRQAARDRAKAAHDSEVLRLVAAHLEIPEPADLPPASVAIKSRRHAR